MKQLRGANGAREKWIRIHPVLLAVSFLLHPLSPSIRAQQTQVSARQLLAASGGEAIERVAARLPENAAVAFFQKQSRVTINGLGASAKPRDIWRAIAARHGGEVRAVEIGDDDTIFRLAKLWHDGRDRAVGEQLRAMVFDPLISELADCKRLLVYADGGFEPVALEDLPLGASGDVGDLYTIAYHYNWHGFGEPDFSSRANRRAFLSFGDDPPRKLDSSASRFEQLFRALHWQPEIWGPTRWQEDGWMRALEGQRVIHLESGQGIVRVVEASELQPSGNSLGAWVECTPAPGRQFTCDEIARFDLRACELFVLAAPKSSEGIYLPFGEAATVPAAVRAAGAEYCLTFQGEVLGAVSKDLLAGIYERIGSEEDPLDAFYAVRNALQTESSAGELSCWRMSCGPEAMR